MALPARDKSSKYNLHELVPHRSTMLLIDRIIEMDETSAVAEKFIEKDAFFLDGHFPGTPVVPGIITCECLFQTGAALLASETPSEGVPVVARADNVRLKQLVLPGDTLELRVEIRERLAGAIFMHGVARVAGKVAASVDFRCTMVKAPRVLASEDKNDK